MTALDPFIHRSRVAYFSMEIALRPEIHTYSGGLGVLAGDTARSSAELELPVVFVTLISRQGYVRQDFDAQGRQLDHPDPWEPSSWTVPLGDMVAVRIAGREVWIRPWLLAFSCPLGTCVPILFLDTDLEQNHPDDRRITDHLYGGDPEYRLKQNIVLGIGGVRVLQTLGFRIATYHMNEGHAALLAVQLLRQSRRPDADVKANQSPYDMVSVRDMCVFTTHTPVGVASDQFPYDLVNHLLGDYVDLNTLKSLGGKDGFNFTLLALNLSAYVNGVANSHAETTHRMFPGYHVHAITNGVHAATWTHAGFARLYQANFKNWQHEPELLSRADQLSDETVWEAHQEAKRGLIDVVKQRCGIEMRIDLPIIGFARRMTGYKRPDMLFKDTGRLIEIAKKHPFQIVLGGKAHPRDTDGKRLIEELNGHVRKLSPDIPMAFVPNYDLTLAAALISGADIWLNTPLPPLEASGTSGMKAAFNGVLNASVLDGWWREAWIEGVTGWAIGGTDGEEAHENDAQDLYRKLGDVIFPLYYRDRTRWIWMMKQTISKIPPYFNSQRMMRRYAAEAYLR